MNMKSVLRIGYAGIVAAALMLPAVLMPLRRDSENSAENRVLAPAPSLHLEDGSFNENLAADAEAWFSDHFALRSELVTGYGRLTKALFATSAEPDVIIGSDGWLYYAETVRDATGVQTLSDNAMKQIVRILEMVRSYCNSNKAKLILAVAPDKASIYPEHLPARYLHTHQENNLDRLYAALHHANITVCDLRGKLLDAKAQGSYQLYHKLDTHWNGDGAMAAYTGLMRTAGLDDFGFADAARTVTQDFEGDLWKMLMPDEDNPDANAVYAVPQTYRTVGRFRSTDDMTIRTSCADGTGSLLMFRDSFGRALIPLLSQRFASCTYSRASAVPVSQIEQTPADFVIYEVVERNIPHLLMYTPDMPAPEAAAPQNPVTPADTAPLTLLASESGSRLLLCGLYDADYSDCDEIVCTVGDRCYTAFPCCEADRLGLDFPSENGFSLRIPAEDAPDGIEIRITVRRGNAWYDLGTAQAVRTTETEEES